jgi:nucleoside-diphosphate-sugar epimerase
MDSDFIGPVNIGSEEMISINNLARLVMELAAKKVEIRNIPGPTGVRGRNSDNKLIGEKLGWKPSRPLAEGLAKTYAWIHQQVAAQATGSLAALGESVNEKQPATTSR